MINKNVMKCLFSHWPCNSSSDSRIGFRMAVLSQGELLKYYELIYLLFFYKTMKEDYVAAAVKDNFRE